MTNSVFLPFLPLLAPVIVLALFIFLIDKYPMLVAGLDEKKAKSIPESDLRAFLHKLKHAMLFSLLLILVIGGLAIGVGSIWLLLCGILCPCIGLAYYAIWLSNHYFTPSRLGYWVLSILLCLILPLLYLLVAG